MEIHEALKAWRKACNLSQAEVAGNLEVAQQNYQRWESGKVMPTAGVIKKLAEYYNADANVLLGIVYKDED